MARATARTLGSQQTGVRRDQEASKEHRARERVAPHGGFDKRISDRGKAADKRIVQDDCRAGLLGGRVGWCNGLLAAMIASPLM